MRSQRLALAVAGCAALALVAAACGSKDNGNDNNSAGNTGGNSTPVESSGGGSSTPPPSGNALNACMVLDTGGVDDKSFNQSSYAGLQAAQKGNSNIKISYVPSNSGNDYVPN